MFFLNNLFKYFAMNTSFRVSLLYLLLIIPQHGNSPLPVMESWLQKDQNDGFAERDMTSSLTGGDESFGSAHQTYQNSLIRKKKADTLGNPLPATDYRSFASKFNRYAQPNLFLGGNYFNSEQADNMRRSNLFDDAPLSYNPYPSRPPSYVRMVEDSPDPLFMNVLGEDPNLLNTKMRILNNRLNLHAETEKNLNVGNEDLERSNKWEFCKRLKARYARNPYIGGVQASDDRDSLRFDESSLLQNDYLPLEEEQSDPEIKNQEYKDVNRPGGKNPQIFDENEYYENEANPVIGEDDINLESDDYNQMINEHAYMHKRDEAKQTENNQNIRNSEAAKVVIDALKTPDFGRTYMSDPSLVAMQEDLPQARKSGVKTHEIDSVNINRVPDSDLIWKLTSDFQTKELNNVMRNSQRALQEVQQFQQRLSYKSGDGNENEGLKRQSRGDPLMRKGMNLKNMNFDEKRLKREDEDEQKNMKTGTDEGGGGEYEDEEGKGHKDEEEYYEDADLSNNESGTEIQAKDELNQKYVKREATEDKKQNNAKNEPNDASPQEYELNLDNAPIENAEKSRKTSYREGEKTQKSSLRKGVKIWDEWGKWAPCSVTCGVGRSTRWRHCIGGGCAQGEKEAQIKRCTNPAC